MKTYTYISLILLVFLPQVIFGQCSTAIQNFSLGNDTTLCSSPYMINAGGNFQSYEWNNGSTNDYLIANTSGNYWVTVLETNGNVILNGDFESGATGFSTDYNTASGGPWGPLSNPGEYMISTSPSLTHTNFSNCGDHTTGTGNMFIVNGSSVPNSNVWCQTVNNITPNTDYAFSCWAMNVLNSTNISNLQFFINGVQIGSVFNTSTTGCVWQQFTDTWNSGTATSATLCITNQNTSAGGNDFAIDDIVFGPICTTTDTINLTFENFQQTLSSVPPLCAGTSTGEIHVDNPGAIEYSFDNGATYQVDSFLLNIPAGMYNVCSRSAAGCEYCGNILVSDPPPVGVSVSNDTTICENGTATINAIGSNGTSFVYHWDFTTDQASQQTVSPGVQTNYHVAAENQNGCISDTQEYILTYYPPLAGVISPDTLVCPDDVATLVSAANGGIGSPYTFAWSTGTNDTQNNFSSENVSPPTTTVFDVTITDACESTPITLSTTVNISPLPNPGFTALEIEQCEPAVFELTSTADPALTQNIEWWINNTEYHPTGNPITSEVYMEGLYDVTMRITSPIGCVIEQTFTDTLVVHPLPVAAFDYGPKPIYMFSPVVDFTNQSTDAVNYVWTFYDGDPGTSQNEELTVNYPEGLEGEFQVQLVAISSFGCRDTLIKPIKIEPEILIYAPNSFTPDDDEFNPTWRLYMEGIDVYSFDLVIYDRWGEIVFESQDITQPWDGTYNGQRVKDGTYVWKLRVRELNTDKRLEYHGSISVLK
ncbi:gliding motility-associated C-terminal domain-containing protein [Lishizhenia tianjinensis]|uniref:Gliding motility-associated C-terminal domain-containing protein n=1 Tax=Lishizhenia tianjinensis TaxID=477690 RepID=A0A1I6ZRQ1_9FLAO|nr:gliding motility-associated C-terminal domain-containing protein [Lishizhenia tianjinensis]SFT65267.1 gliding motility-associated C-terminal domain-containing protein [Lishizhenia tianjinensis]